MVLLIVVMTLKITLDHAETAFYVPSCLAVRLNALFRIIENSADLVVYDLASPSEQRSSSLAFAPRIVGTLSRLMCALARDGMSLWREFRWCIEDVSPEADISAQTRTPDVDPPFASIQTQILHAK